MAEKPRILHDGRDMVWSLLALLAICVVFVLINGNFTWGFSGPDDSKIPTFDVSDSLAIDARTQAYPIRDPQVPDDWHGNSGSTLPLDGGVVTNVGWLNSEGSYIQLSQTAAPEAALIADLGGPDALGKGTRDFDGQQWVIYSNPENKEIWATDLGDVRVGIVSRGSEAAMVTLAEAVLAAQPLPRG